MPKKKKKLHPTAPDIFGPDDGYRPTWRCPECDELLFTLRLYKAHLNRCRAALGFRNGARVQTPEGPGVIVGTEMRKNTNNGPGTRQFRVQLEDGRVHRYARERLSLLATP